MKQALAFYTSTAHAELVAAVENSSASQWPRKEACFVVSALFRLILTAAWKKLLLCKHVVQEVRSKDLHKRQK